MSNRSSLVLALTTLAFGAVMFVEPLGIASGEAFRDNDWLNCRSFDVLSRIAILEHGQFPLRSHLIGGGFPTFAHPSDGSWAPTLLPVLLFGDVIGVKVNLLVMLFLGAWGTLRLGRWLGLSEEAARFAGLAMLVSGWAPSMLLVGFYNQAFYLLAPAILALLLEAKERVSSLLLAGFLYFLVLQQGGHAFPAIGYALGVASLLAAAATPATLRLRWLHPLVVLFGFGAPLALEAYGDLPVAIPIGWTLTALALAFLPGGRDFVRAAGPFVMRLGGLLATSLALGIGKVVGLLHLDSFGEYSHELVRSDALWFPSPRPGQTIPWEERYYESISDFVVTALQRAPSEAEYVVTWGRVGDPVSYEYAWLGLTPVLAILAVVGVGFAVRAGGKPMVAALVGALFTAICFGWHLPPDLHFLLTAGVPRLDQFSQPIKYWNFFIVLAAALLAGIAYTPLVQRFPRLEWLLIASLAWPFAQNQGALLEQFSQPVPAGAEQSEFTQVAQVADAKWAELGEEAVREMSDELHLRDYVRAHNASEYINSQRGVGTIDHYGSVVGAEYSSPANYITLLGDEVPNPYYRGEAWFEGGETKAGAPDGADLEVRSLSVTPNVVQVEVSAPEATTLIVNQAWLDGFTLEGPGTLRADTRLLTVELPPGEHSLRLVYRPVAFVAGLVGSGVAFVLWLLGLIALRRRGL
ncbi:MAG: hypothetical protein KDA24_27920 [Deltaproteobacteria bacterium]|nr:hypothetical protein [Deltaproteobacteria bacterium]